MSAENIHGRAVLIFVLGIVGIAVCGCAAPVAWLMGISYRNQCLEAEVPEESFGSIGRILGMIGTAIFLLSTVLAFAVVAVELLVIWLML